MAQIVIAAAQAVATTEVVKVALVSGHWLLLEVGHPQFKLATVFPAASLLPEEEVVAGTR